MPSYIQTHSQADQHHQQQQQKEQSSSAFTNGVHIKDHSKDDHDDESLRLQLSQYSFPKQSYLNTTTSTPTSKGLPLTLPVQAQETVTGYDTKHHQQQQQHNTPPLTPTTPRRSSAIQFNNTPPPSASGSGSGSGIPSLSYSLSTPSTPSSSTSTTSAYRRQHRRSRGLSIDSDFIQFPGDFRGGNNTTTRQTSYFAATATATATASAASAASASYPSPPSNSFQQHASSWSSASAAFTAPTSKIIDLSEVEKPLLPSSTSVPYGSILLSGNDNNHRASSISKISGGFTEGISEEEEEEEEEEETVESKTMGHDSHIRRTSNTSEGLTQGQTQGQGQEISYRTKAHRKNRSIDKMVVQRVKKFVEKLN